MSNPALGSLVYWCVYVCARTCSSLGAVVLHCYATAPGVKSASDVKHLAAVKIEQTAERMSKVADKAAAAFGSKATAIGNKLGSFWGKGKKKGKK